MQGRSTLVIGAACLAGAACSLLIHLLSPLARSSSQEDDELPEPKVLKPPPQLDLRARSHSKANLLAAWPSYHSLDLAKGSPSRRTALLIVDVQPAYWDHNPALQAAFPEFPKHVSSLLDTAREVLRPSQIVHIRANYSFKFAENFCRLNPDKRLPDDIDSCDWCKSEAGEVVIAKPAMDGFHDTMLLKHLKSIGAEHVVVCGLLTSVCVLFTCQSAFAAGLRVTLYQRGCADRSLERHQQCLDHYSDYIFSKVDDDPDLETIFTGPVDPSTDEDV